MNSGFSQNPVILFSKHPKDDILLYATIFNTNCLEFHFRVKEDQEGLSVAVPLNGFFRLTFSSKKETDMISGLQTFERL